MHLPIRPLTRQHVRLFDEHFFRHKAESGRGDYHFMPFEPGDAEGPRGLDARLLELPLDAPGWQRWWVAWSADERSIVGHVNLKGDHLKTGLHRCELGVGIERAHRAHGLGRCLMAQAIDFCRAAPSLVWLDLRVFGHNTNARGLYTTLGFVEVGVLADRFRIGADQIDDVIMTLKVGA
jgi:RimJ/RimL family protein N-acetyltransferase